MSLKLTTLRSLALVLVLALAGSMVLNANHVHNDFHDDTCISCSAGGNTESNSDSEAETLPAPSLQCETPQAPESQNVRRRVAHYTSRAPPASLV